jgi:hypothetical protein
MGLVCVRLAGVSEPCHTYGNGSVRLLGIQFTSAGAHAEESMYLFLPGGRQLSNSDGHSHHGILLVWTMEVHCAAPEPRIAKLHFCRTPLMWQGVIGYAL